MMYIDDEINISVTLILRKKKTANSAFVLMGCVFVRNFAFSLDLDFES